MSRFAEFHKTFLRVAFLALIAFQLSVIGNAQQVPPPPTAPAAEANPAPTPSLSLSPAVVVARGSFGQALAQTLTLSNQTSRDFAFEMEADDVTIKDGKRDFVPAGQMPKSIAATAVFSQPRGIVKAHSSQSVEVRITLPEATDIRAVVAIFRGVENLNSGSSVGMTASLGTLLTFNLTDHVAIEASELKVSAPTTTAPLRVTQYLENKGSEPLIPEGVAVFLDEKGKLSAKLEFPQQRLLPGEKLEFSADYTGDLRPGKYKVMSSFQYEGKTMTTEATHTAE